VAFPQGLCFRDTAGYVTDSGSDTFAIVNLFGSLTYPVVSPQGNTYGSTVSNTPLTVNRTTSLDPRLAGIMYSPSNATRVRIDLPAPGSYNIRCASGDASFANRSEWDLYDDTAFLANLVTGSVASGSFKDANDVSHTGANWPANNTPKIFTFSSSICVLRCAVTTGNSVMAYFYIEAAGGGGGSDPAGPLIGGPRIGNRGRIGGRLIQ
jgi:hypothetical protein